MSLDITKLIAGLHIAAKGSTAIAAEETRRAGWLTSWAERLTNGETPATTWAWPVGTDEYPSEKWYCATWHDLTGRRNNGYAHTGGDLNLDVSPHGNIDVGQPVFAVADGEVVSVGFSERYRAGIVIKVKHFGLDLFVRYWHLTRQTANIFQVGDAIGAGANLGAIDHYPYGYAHCHFDMAWTMFERNWWWTYHPEVEWANPTYILKAHLDPVRVDKMLARGE